MNEITNMLPTFFVGVFLGAAFFGGLWITVKIGLRSKKSGLIFIGSFIFRMGVVVLGFYYVGATSWQKMVVALAGFLIARTVITRIIQKNSTSKTTVLKD